jgi:hypothetical protein
VDDKSDDEAENISSPLHACSEYLSGLPERDVAKVFIKALKAWKALLDSKAVMTEHQQYQVKPSLLLALIPHPPSLSVVVRLI